MVKATLLYRSQYIEVEILDVYTTLRGDKRAVIVALEGEPFDTITHGGPAKINSMVVDAGSLRDIAISTELQPATMGVALPV